MMNTKINEYWQEFQPQYFFLEEGNEKLELNSLMHDLF